MRFKIAGVNFLRNEDRTILNPREPPRLVLRLAKFSLCEIIEKNQEKRGISQLDFQYKPRGRKLD